MVRTSARGWASPATAVSDHPVSHSAAPDTAWPVPIIFVASLIGVPACRFDVRRYGVSPQCQDAWPIRLRTASAAAYPSLLSIASLGPNGYRRPGESGAPAPEER